MDQLPLAANLRTKRSPEPARFRRLSAARPRTAARHAARDRARSSRSDRARAFFRDYYHPPRFAHAGADFKTILFPALSATWARLQSSHPPGSWRRIEGGALSKPVAR